MVPVLISRLWGVFVAFVAFSTNFLIPTETVQMSDLAASGGKKSSLLILILVCVDMYGNVKEQ